MALLIQHNQVYAFPRLLVVVAVWLISCGMSKAQSEAAREHQVKAVFLFNFAQFVQWPDIAFDHTTSQLVIGVLGTDPFGSFLDETVKGESVNGHPLRVLRFQKPEDVVGCHILFIQIPKNEQLREVLEKLKGRHILTVSESTTFIKQGGIVRFVKENNKIRFQINLAAAKEADLVISSKLLRLAEVVSN
ncbi:MAG TPA: YfiR family protein [Ohtaekwangia sp.]